MRHWITNNGKILRHCLLLIYFCSTTALADSLSVNVYLKLASDNKVGHLIKEFNQLLADEQVLKTYQITPYLDKHPLHITLYMARFDEQKIPQIIAKTKKIATQYRKIPILTSVFVPNTNGYLMLSVTNDAQLQGLSNKALTSLYQLRDKKAPIPTWATRNIDRQDLFNQYGSPSVLNYFSPHLSIFAADHLSKFDVARLYAQVKKLVQQFDDNHQTQVKATAYAIGVGVANEQGQIIKELTSFPLS